jgi:CheY-like chemotaxis protein
VVTAESAAAALVALETPPQGAPFELLLSDIGMAGEDGYELMRRVRAHAGPRVSRIKAVALTVYGRSEDRLNALQAGYQMHVHKPAEEDELTMVVASLTGRLALGIDASH